MGWDGMGWKVGWDGRGKGGFRVDWIRMDGMEAQLVEEEEKCVNGMRNG